MERSFPLINKQAARTIQGRHTEVMVTSFQDKILIIVSQYGKVGSVIHTSLDQQSLAPTSSNTLAPTSSNFLLGAGSSTSKKTQLYQVYASHISQMIVHQNPQEGRPVVLSLALSIQEPDMEHSVSQAQEQEQRQLDRDLFENVVDMVNECCRALAYLRHGDDDNDYELSHDSDELYRQCVSYLLDELLVRVPVRYTGLLRESYVGNPNILSLASASSCTGITSLQYDLDCITLEEIDNLGPFIRRTPSLSKVGVHAVSSKVELDFTFETGLEAMESCLWRLEEMSIKDMAGSRFSQAELEWMKERTPLLETPQGTRAPS
ncbi:hypothetical protein BGZ74_001110 [Mortierella antarctica]|nr:hypothetical protein BGZ74_001110 [Mortierella antarctica]